MTPDPLNNLDIPKEPEIPFILEVALQISRLSFPNLIYTGQVVSESEDINDCELSLVARAPHGDPAPQASITLEIVRVGLQRSITVEYPGVESIPILWYGQHPVWMDGDSGITVPCPPQGIRVERFARGILKRLEAFDEISASG